MPWPVTLNSSNCSENDQRTLGEYEKFRQESYLCDVKLFGHGSLEGYLCHRVVVGAFSRKLERDLVNFDAEPNEQLMEHYLPFVSDDILQLILFWIYHGFVEISSPVVAFRVVKAALTLEMLNLYESSLDAIVNNLNSDTVFYCLFFDHERIFDACIEFLCWNFKDLFSTCHKSIMNLPIEIFSKLISDDRLNVVAEDDVWTAVLDWVQDQWEDRRQHLSQLLNTVRIGLIKEHTFNAIRSTVNDLDDNMPEESYFSDVFSALPREDRLFRPRYPDQLLVVIITSLVTPTNLDVFTKLYSYDLKSNTWENFGPTFDFRVVSASSVPSKPGSIALLTSKHKPQDPWMYKVVILNLNTFEIDVLPTLNESSPFFSRHPQLCVVKGNLALFQVNKYFEMYDDTENAWKFCKIELDPPPRDGAVLRESSFASNGDDLYLIGGQLDRGALTNVWKFNSDQHMFSVVGHLQESRCFSGAGCGDDKLFVAGGFTGGEFVLSGIPDVEEYDLTDNTTRKLPPMDMSATFHPSLICLKEGLVLVENAYDLAPLGRHHKRRVQFLPHGADRWEWRKPLCFRHLCTSHSMVSVPSSKIKNIGQHLSPDRLSSVKDIAESYIRSEDAEGVYDLSKLFTVPGEDIS